MSVRLRLFAESLESAWRRLAESIGGTYHEGGFVTRAAVQLTSGDWVVTLDTAQRDDGVSYTRIRAPFTNPEGFRFRIKRRGLFSWVGRLLKLQDVEVGYPGFDRDFIIRGDASPDRLRRFLANHRIRLLMIRQPRLDLEVRDDPGWLRPGFPRELDQLEFRERGVIKDVYRLEGLFQLFVECLREMCWNGAPEPTGLRTHVARVRAPGEVERGYLRWEGDRVRQEAAQALAELGDTRAVPALLDTLGSVEAYDPVLRARVIEALAALGDQRAVGPLVALLGNAREADGRPVRDRAASALRVLGADDVAGAVLLALSGDRSGLAGAAERFPIEVADACVAGLHGPAPGHAAAALEALHATWALPQLRAALRLHGRRSAAGAAIDAAIFSLESLAALPRAADGGEILSDTLPRPAGTAQEPPRTLPRPARRRGGREARDAGPDSS